MFKNLKGKLSELQVQLSESPTNDQPDNPDEKAARGHVRSASTSLLDKNTTTRRAPAGSPAETQQGGRPYDEWTREQLIRHVRRLDRAQKALQQSVDEGKRDRDKLQRTIEDQQDGFSRRIKDKNEEIRSLQDQTRLLTARAAESKRVDAENTSQEGGTEGGGDVLETPTDTTSQPSAPSPLPSVPSELPSEEGGEQAAALEAESVRSLRAQLRQMMAKVDTLTAQYNGAREEAARLAKQLDGLQGPYQAALQGSQRVEQLDRQVAQLERDLAREQARAGRAEEGLSALQVQHSAIERELQQAHERRAALDRQLAVLEEKANTWEARCQRAQAAKDTVEEQVEQLRSQASSKDSQVEAAAVHVQQLQAHVEALQAEKEEMGGRVEELRAQLADAEAQREGLMASLHAAEENMKAQEGKEQEHSEGLARAQQQLGEVEAQHQATVRSLNRKIMDLKRTLSKHVRQGSGGEAIDEQAAAAHTGHAQVMVQQQHTAEAVGRRESTVSQGADGPDVNYHYLKNVVFKFITAKNSERRHLVTVLSTVLHFDQEEAAAARKAFP
eukprot:comp24035_c1_seq1/m.43033 comp24035_c1_seq1/g.43033  ORF comp24035_c1_seq1/g.43033 comp24035_c1_seq1/m.43033 type:complete len:558 (-) comp24035_c1_seq1:547-2220(-)